MNGLEYAHDMRSDESLVAPASSPAPRTPAWYGIWTHSHFEDLVTGQLIGKGFDVFLPKTRTWVRRNGVRKQHDVPMFPSYVFVRHAMDKIGHVEILKARGVVRVLGTRWDQLTPIPDREIEAVQRVVSSHVPVFPHRMLREGSRVRLVGGPFVGLEGAFLRGRADRGLLVVAINLLQRAVAVEVDCTLVEAI